MQSIRRQRRDKAHSKIRGTAHTTANQSIGGPYDTRMHVTNMAKKNKKTKKKTKAESNLYVVCGK